MNSTFVLTTSPLGSGHAIPSTAETFRRARAAVDHLLACLAIEEAFAIVVANYVSFEKAVAGANIDNMVERGVSILALHSQRREIDRHLVNLLAAGQMFTDHVKRRTRHAYGRTSLEATAVEAAFTGERGRLLGFWATESLRDAVLHNSLPVTSWTRGGGWVDAVNPDGTFDKLAPGARLEHRVTFAFDPLLLALDRKVDRGLISQLEARAEKNGTVSWVPIIREYLEALSLVLKQVRLTFEPCERAAVELMSQLTESFVSSLPEGVDQPRCVFIVERAEKNRWLQDLPLDSGFEDHIQELRRQHQPMINLHRRALAG